MEQYIKDIVSIHNNTICQLTISPDVVATVTLSEPVKLLRAEKRFMEFHKEYEPLAHFAKYLFSLTGRRCICATLHALFATDINGWEIFSRTFYEKYLEYYKKYLLNPGESYCHVGIVHGIIAIIIAHVHPSTPDQANFVRAMQCQQQN